MQHPASRDDLSRFLIHLTRDYEGVSAENNLISILKMRKIQARNAHCLFKHDLAKLRLSSTLQKRFTTVCFTEAPLPQIKRLIAKVAGRQIQLQPYGLVFDKDFLLARGASPAIYVNAKGTQLRDYLLVEFRKQFEKIKTLRSLKKSEQEYYESIVQYYSLINIISNNYDFTWEREWRLTGDLAFKYLKLIAIIAEDPDDFESLCEEQLPKQKFRYIQMLPIISPEWSYEDIRVYHGLCYTVSSIKEAQIMLRYHDIPTHTTDL